MRYPICRKILYQQDITEMSKSDIQLAAKSYISAMSAGYHNRRSKMTQTNHTSVGCHSDIIIRHPIGRKIIYQQDIIEMSKLDIQSFANCYISAISEGYHNQVSK